MAAPFSVSMLGVRRLARKLGKDLVRNPLKELLTTAALTAERTARGKAPKDTGALARSITSRARSQMAMVGSTLPYARAVEEGARPGGEGRFFMRAAADHVQREMPRRLDDMGRAIRARWSS